MKHAEWQHFYHMKKYFESDHWPSKANRVLQIIDDGHEHTFELCVSETCLQEIIDFVENYGAQANVIK